MKLYSWNVNGIRAVEKKGALEQFIRAEQPDVICFQETKAHPRQIDLGYPSYEKHWHSADKAGYSGTAIWSKLPINRTSQGLPAELVKKYDLLSDTYGNPDQEGRVLTAEFDTFYLVTVYTPNSKGDLSRLTLRDEQWDPAFLEYLLQLESEKPVVFCGDLNVAHAEIDLANPKPNVGKHGFTHEERRGFQNFIDNGFVDTFRLFTKEGGHYSWWTHWANSRARNVGWRIDYFLVSGTLKDIVTDANIHASIMGSDHCPVSISLKDNA